MPFLPKSNSNVCLLASLQPVWITSDWVLSWGKNPARLISALCDWLLKPSRQCSKSCSLGKRSRGLLGRRSPNRDEDSSFRGSLKSRSNVSYSLLYCPPGRTRRTEEERERVNLLPTKKSLKSGWMCNLPRKRIRRRSEPKLRSQLPRKVHKAMVQGQQHLSLLQNWSYLIFYC